MMLIKNNVFRIVLSLISSLLSGGRACTGFVLITINTIFTMALFYPIGLIKKFCSNNIIVKNCLIYLHFIGKIWIFNNYIIIKLLSGIKWNIEGLDSISDLPKNKWYLLISNHQSWSDVLVLQFLLNKKIPFQKYFVKEKMRKFPIMGFVWESIDCVFLQRNKNTNNTAEKSSSDINLIKDKCKKFKLVPASISTFAEGTRYTKEKAQIQNSPYKYLLKPKAGGIAAVLEELHNEIKGIVDVSLCYSPRKFSFWDLFSGKLNQIDAKINFIAIPEWLKDKYNNKISYSQYKDELQEWIDNIWLSKDSYLSLQYDE